MDFAVRPSHRPVADDRVPPDALGDRAATAPRRSASGSLPREIVTFAAIGVVSTLAYAVLYAFGRTSLGSVAANALALVTTAGANTLANRRLTFGVRGRANVAHHVMAGFLAFAVAFLITTFAVTLLGVLAPGAGRLTEIVVLIVANVAATAARFVLLRFWIGTRQLRPAIGSDLERNRS